MYFSTFYQMIGCVSTTGHGETIMRFNVAQRILQEMQHSNVSAQTATENVLHAMTSRLNYTAGAITISKDGNVGIYFTSQKMAWAYQKGNEIHSGIRIGDNFVENA